jgi:hypothetical protein
MELDQHYGRDYENSIRRGTRPPIKAIICLMVLYTWQKSLEVPGKLAEPPAGVVNGQQSLSCFVSCHPKVRCLLQAMPELSSATQITLPITVAYCMAMDNGVPR